MAINDRGQVVGWSYDASQDTAAFLWETGHISNLGVLPGYHGAEANSINNEGWIVGRCINSNNSSDYAAFIVSNGVMHELSSLGGWSTAYAISAGGDIVGASKPDSREHDACVWRGSNLVDLLTYNSNGNGSSGAWGINQAGQVVGMTHMWTGHGETWRPFVWQDLNGNYSNDYPVEMVVLGTLGGWYGKANDINNQGVIVGHAQTAAGTFGAFMVTPSNGVWKDPADNINITNYCMKDLGTLYSDGYAEPTAINDYGMIVGTTKAESGDPPAHAFVSWGESLTDLNTLIDTNTGWDLKQASDVNHSGWIAGFGTISGETHACVLIPQTDEIFFTEISGATNDPRMRVAWSAISRTNRAYTLKYVEALGATNWKPWADSSDWPRYDSWWEGAQTQQENTVILRVFGE
jgi:probable HAF family extracellular repeat protein